MKDEKNSAEKNFLGFLGLCRRAGRAICGTPLVCTALGSGQKPCLVLYSTGASQATQKKLKNKCAYYTVPLRAINVSPSLLASAMGKGSNLTAIGITDKGFADAILTKIDALETAEETAQNSTGKESFAGRK